MKKLLALVCAVVFSTGSLRAAEAFQDRFVWVFGWNLGSDRNVSEIARVLQAAGKGGLNGAVASFGLDTLCKQSPEYFVRLATVQEICRTNGLEFIPAVFSIGYGGGVLSHDRNLAEGLAVQDAPFVVKGETAALATSQQALLANGGFEEFDDLRLKTFNFHDQPGEISFIDREIKRTGSAALRFENFTINQHGHARVMQTVKVQPRRCYRVTFWAR
jgi:hypothetical protein